MRSQWIWILCFAFAVVAARSEEVTSAVPAVAAGNAPVAGVTSNDLPTTITIGRDTYENIRWSRVTPATVTIFHKSGVATIPLEKLAPALRKRFGYDPQKAAEYVAAEEKMRSARREAPAAVETLRGPSVPNSTEPPVVTRGTPPFDNPFWYTSRTVPAGQYALGTTKILIDHENDKASAPAITFANDVSVSNGTLSLMHGKLTAGGVRFTNVTLEEELGFLTDFNDSSFKNCLFSKGGGWFVSRYSARFVFHRCVFSQRLAYEQWNMHDFGVMADNCTFEDISFPKYLWTWGAEAADPAKEQGQTDSGFYFRNCVFKKCVVPESVLLACRSCLFDQCKFVKENDLATGTQLSVTNSLKNQTQDAYIPASTAGGKIRFVFDY